MKIIIDVDDNTDTNRLIELLSRYLETEEAIKLLKSKQFDKELIWPLEIYQSDLRERVKDLLMKIIQLHAELNRIELK